MTAHLTGPNGDLELPLAEATCGCSGYDISRLLRTTGNVTLDPGFANTASCQSAITFIDGGEGVLRYRGYPIEQLAEKSTFLETAWLVLYGELPTADEVELFEHDIKRSMLIDERMRDFFRTFPRRSHPMPVLSAGIMALQTFNADSVGFSPEEIGLATIRLLAKVPTLAAYGYKNSLGRPTLYPDMSLSYVENFLRMSFGQVTEPYEFDDAVTRALEVLLILHADHEQNCSTSTVRLVGSADASLYASVAAGVNALSGPKHGGANQEVVEMLQQIKDSGLTTKQFVEKVKNKESDVKLMGFGHRVYKNYDPRAAIIKEHADAILNKHVAGADESLLEIAKELEQTALEDDYFAERKLYPNVDFYSGLIYEAMGFPVNMFTVLFAIGRLPGWIAQWREMRNDPTTRIGRPRQVYVGQGERDYVSIRER